MQVSSCFHFVVLISLSLCLSSCTPKDENVKRPTRSPFAQAHIERVNVTGVDYLQYISQRLAEVKRFTELVMKSPSPLDQEISGPSCGRVVVDKTEGPRRFLRLKTQNCLVDAKKELKLNLLADGEEVFDIQLNQLGKVTRASGATVGSYIVGGVISAGDLKQSSIKSRERREFSLDLLNEDSSGTSHFRFSYSVEMHWKQGLTTPSFAAFESNAQNLLQISGVMAINQETKMTVDQVRFEVTSEREISERKRKANANTPAKSFHNVTLLLEAEETNKGVFDPLVFKPEQCEMPQGKLKVAVFSTSLSGDKLSSREHRNVELKPLGLFVPAIQKREAWLDCRPQIDLQLPGGVKTTVPGMTPKIRPGEIGNRNAYLSLFFK